MDEQIQQILQQANSSQTTPDSSQQANDPISAIMQSAGVAPQNPSDVNNAQQAIGKTDDSGYCQRFAEKVTNSKEHFPSAVAAWNAYVKQGKAYQDVSKAPPGSLIYYAPDASNEGFGHVAVTDGKGNQIGATYKGVQQDSVQNWQQATKQVPLGFVIP